MLFGSSLNMLLSFSFGLRIMLTSSSSLESCASSPGPRPPSPASFEASLELVSSPIPEDLTGIHRPDGGPFPILSLKAALKVVISCRAPKEKRKGRRILLGEPCLW